MNDAEQFTVVWAGSELMGEEQLGLMRLPDGRTGAFRRGQVFPLRADGSVDIAGEFVMPGDCLPLLPEPHVKPALAWNLTDDDPPLLLVRGDDARFEQLLAAIVGAGGQIRASGPYLAGIDNDEPFEWFALPTGLTASGIEAALRCGFGAAAVAPTRPAALRAAAAEREAILRGALEALRAEAREAGERVAEMSVRLADTATRLGQAEDALTEAVAEATRARELAERLATATEAAAAASHTVRHDEPVAAPRQSVKRFVDAIAEAIAVLLPRLALLRDTKESLSLSLRDRGPVLRALRDLQDRPADTLTGWKGVRGAAAWREKHVSTGQDDSGRIYARHVEGGRVEVLLSSKSRQDRDIEWLARQ